MPEPPIRQCTEISDNVADHLVAALIPEKQCAVTDQPNPLPLGPLASLSQEESLTYQIASIDARGRISDRSCIQALGWNSHDRLSIDIVSDGMVLACPHRHGAYTLTQHGYVRLPAPVRHWCGMHAGHRTFLAAAIEHDVLVIHPMSALDAMVLGYYRSLPEGRQS